MIRDTNWVRIEESPKRPDSPVDTGLDVMLTVKEVCCEKRLVPGLDGLPSWWADIRKHSPGTRPYDVLRNLRQKGDTFQIEGKDSVWKFTWKE